MISFKINNDLQVVCQAESTRYGFRHLATLLRNGSEVSKAKACYYNRTWERYTYESVLKGLLNKAKDRIDFLEKAEFEAMIARG